MPSELRQDYGHADVRGCRGDHRGDTRNPWDVAFVSERLLLLLQQGLLQHPCDRRRKLWLHAAVRRCALLGRLPAHPSRGPVGSRACVRGSVPRRSATCVLHDGCARRQRYQLRSVARCNTGQHAATPPSRVERRVGAAASTSLSGCNAKAIYTAWGATFQSAWPTLNYACTVGSVTCAMCITNGNIGAAVMAWATSPSTAAATYGDIADWDTSAVSSMSSLFDDKPTFNADISKWDTASVGNMANMFSNATAFNQNLANWNVLRVTQAGFANMWSGAPPPPVKKRVARGMLLACSCVRHLGCPCVGTRVRCIELGPPAHAARALHGWRALSAGQLRGNCRALR